jgi:hypothetical protein
MRLIALGVAMAASLCFTCERASAQTCTDDADKLFRSFLDGKLAMQTKGCSEIDRFISARTHFADFLDTAVANGCSEDYVMLNRLLVLSTYKSPPGNCGTTWSKKGDNRQLQHDAIAVLNRDIGTGVFVDGDTVILKQTFSHEGKHTLGLAVFKCQRMGADAAFAMQCAEDSEPSQSSGYSFDVTSIDPQRIDVTEKAALTVQMGISAHTPEELVKSVTRRGTTSDATRITLNCLPNIQCVHTAAGPVNMNLVQLYCDPEVNCNDVLSHIADMLAMMRRAPH